ncbi:MbtH family NRPS accessory protein [Alisedimentitalea sp. MJ-SS2]|uniref:MbtH family protein n=1 Tax=Aliisedimentitalea sp. MJ-SS2 TaxID=3049795 RepID=UPI00290F2590|nr:MbtH family NRPS accessory protein [Alisedimentitalea sp. MJ-SS2]MDU8929753.1 MbtH family NRPS accessory protein [Alisedimentitalea sp. MJ-SS2]
MKQVITSLWGALVLLAFGLATPAMSGVVFEVETTYVVINHEEQYSIFPADRKPPAGWKKTGKACRVNECLKHIERVWTDMRPLSIRKSVENQLSQHLKKK